MKKLKIVLIVLAGLAIAPVIYIAEPYVVLTDTCDPRFDVKNFRFRYYISYKYDGRMTYNEALKCIFKPGMPKSYVDEILIGHAGGSINGKADSKEFIYNKGHYGLYYNGNPGYPMKIMNLFSPLGHNVVIIVEYNSENKLSEIFYGKGGLFEPNRRLY